MWVYICGRNMIPVIFIWKNVFRYSSSNDVRLSKRKIFIDNKRTCLQKVYLIFVSNEENTKLWRGKKLTSCVNYLNVKFCFNEKITY